MYEVIWHPIKPLNLLNFEKIFPRAGQEKSLNENCVNPIGNITPRRSTKSTKLYKLPDKLALSAKKGNNRFYCPALYYFRDLSLSLKDPQGEKVPVRTTSLELLQ
jgi:hypothetical protein